MMKKQIQDVYLDWFNNFLTVERFAEHYELTVDQANELIKFGHELHEGIVENIKINDEEIYTYDLENDNLI